MNPFANVKTVENVNEESDFVGGRGPLDSDLYFFNVDLAYFGQSEKGAINVTFHLSTEDGREHRETVYVTNRNKENFYVDKKTGENNFLPGYNLANSICLLTVGKELGEMDVEEKTVNLYNFEAKKELPAKVPVLVDLLGQSIIVGVRKAIVDKTVKQGNDYVPTGETREISEMDKAFRASDKMTTAEIRGGATEAAFIGTWEKKNKGQVIDRSTKDAKGVAGAPGAASNAPAANGGRKSLFAAQ